MALSHWLIPIQNGEMEDHNYRIARNAHQDLLLAERPRPVPNAPAEHIWFLENALVLILPLNV